MRARMSRGRADPRDWGASGCHLVISLALPMGGVLTLQDCGCGM